MLKDIRQLAELYLQYKENIPSEQSWDAFHDELIVNSSLENIRILTDVMPAKCKYALFINVETKTKTYNIRDYVEMNAIENWSDHLFWQGSGGAKSEKIRSSPHKIYTAKKDFSTLKIIEPLETILEDYCSTKVEKKKKSNKKASGPLFWDEKNLDLRDFLQCVVDILKENIEKIDQETKEKFPTKESVFVGLTIDNRPIGDYELFRRYLLFVRLRAGIQKGSDLFKNRIISEVIEEENLIGICPSCQNEKPLLNQWTTPAELSFYQTTDKSHLSYEYESTASFRLCQCCSDILYIFKQQLLPSLYRKLGGNECLILPSIKFIPKDNTEKLELYENLKSLWESSKQKIASTEGSLVHRLGKMPSYATVTFVFGDAIITKGDSTNVRRLDKINVIFPDVLPSRLSKIAKGIQNSNQELNALWDLTDRKWQCTWNIQDDFYILKQIFYPSWEEQKKEKSNARPEVERYLRAIFYGNEISIDEIAEDCFSNLISAIKITRNAKVDDKKSMYARDNYVGNLISLFIFLNQLKETYSKYEKDVIYMLDTTFKFNTMPDLGKFIEKHPLFKEDQYLAPFFVGCLFSYAENMQKGNNRLAAYNWLGTMSVKYEDILQDIYPKILNYITNKEKIVSSPRLQELMKAIAHFDKGKCDNDRVALVAFCHGWAVGRDFIYMKNEIKNANTVTT